MGFTTFPASLRTHRRSDGAKLTFPVVHEPFEVCPRPQPYRVTTATSTLTLHPVIPGIGSAPTPRVTPAYTGKLEPTEMGLHVPAALWSATAADESTAMQVCGSNPRSEDQTYAVARSPGRASTPAASGGGFSATEKERSPSWRFSADESMMPFPYGSGIRSFHGLYSPPRCCHPLATLGCAADFPSGSKPTLGEFQAEALLSEASHHPMVDRLT